MCAHTYIFQQFSYFNNRLVIEIINNMQLWLERISLARNINELCHTHISLLASSFRNYILLLISFSLIYYMIIFPIKMGGDSSRHCGISEVYKFGD